MTHDDASVETGVGGQAKYDMMMVFCGNALQKHHKTLKTSTRRYSDCHILHVTCLLFGKCLLVCLLKYPQHTGTGLKCLSKYDVIKLPPPTSTPNDDTVGKEGWGGENVS